MWKSCLVVSALAISLVVGAPDLSGTWDLDVRFDDASLEGGELDCVIQQQGQQLKGTCSGGTAPLSGDVNGQNVRWRIGGSDKSPGTSHTFTGTIDDAGIRIKGRFTANGKDGSFTALKSK
jgi:hypothetical protein